MIGLADTFFDTLRSMTPTAKTGVTLLSAATFVLSTWAITRALTRGHGVHGTLTWTFAILAFPVVGAVAYFLSAGPSVKRVALRKRRAAAQVRQRYGIAGSREEADRETADSLVDLAVSLSGLTPTAGNDVRLLTDDDPTFERIDAAIRDAKRFVWAEYYIIRDDATGRAFLTHLAKRAREGVEVRLIYDAIGSYGINAELVRAIAESGGLVQAFQPMNPLRRRLSVHLRNHRKIVVADGEVAFLGGMNMGDEYSSRRRRKRREATSPLLFHDTHLELRGPAVRSIAQTFVEDWAFAGGAPLEVPPAPPPARSPGSLVAVVPSGPDQEHNASAMVHFAGIAAARRRVRLTSPYFIPDEATVSALVSAALRRVDVRVLVPRLEHNDVKLAAYAARSYYGQLLRGGVRIYEYQPSMLHTKTLVIDGSVAFVGSANVDARSFQLNFEVGALVQDPEFVAEIEKRFVADLVRSREITLEDVAAMSRGMQLRCHLARLLSPVL